MNDTNDLNSNINKIIILNKNFLLNLYFGDFNMSIEEQKIVMPGDKLGIIEQYLPGEGTYDDNGEIKSSVLGNVKINQKMKVISVVSDAKPALLKVGDTVYGQITDIKPQRANVKIECMKDNARPLALPYMGAIHISQAKKDYLEKLSDAFRIGDIIQAKVVKITGDNVDLGTVDDDCGVLKAMCTRCRDYMHTTQKENELQCNSCNKKERRKVSSNYVND
jgi:exosome complex component CSL4